MRNPAARTLLKTAGRDLLSLRVNKEVDGVLMRRKALEWRSKKYVPVQNVSMINWYMDAEDFYQKYKKSDGAGREGANLEIRVRATTVGRHQR